MWFCFVSGKKYAQIESCEICAFIAKASTAVLSVFVRILPFVSSVERAVGKFIQLSTFQAPLGQENCYIRSNQCEIADEFLHNLLV